MFLSLSQVLASRGRKGTDPRDVLRQLSALAYVSRRFGPAKELPVMMHAVASMFDTLWNIDDYMETDMWKSCHSYLSRVSQFSRDDILCVHVWLSWQYASAIACANPYVPSACFGRPP